MLCKKQRNYCTSLLRKSKTNYHTNLDGKKVSENKLFRKVRKPSLSDKSCDKEQINLVENGEIRDRNGFRDTRSFKYFLWKYSKKS